MMHPIRRRQFLAAAPLILAGCRSTEPPVIKVEEFQDRRHSGAIRLACVGDSITYGAGVDDREKNCYPARLGEYLGSSFEVRNLGRNGATLSKSGDLPYWGTAEFKALSEWQPDVILLMLGTNDTKPQNWNGPGPFSEDLKAMIETLRGMKSRPKIWVCLPVPVYGELGGIRAEILDKGVIPSIMEVCSSRKIPVIDVNDALTNKPLMFPDKVHPNAIGADLMAKTIYQAIGP